jgi:hypothetical protein
MTGGQNLFLFLHFFQKLFLIVKVENYEKQSIKAIKPDQTTDDD